MTTELRYRWASRGECGVMYRPGELSMPDMHYCRKPAGHAPPFHSTKFGEHDIGGYDWWMAGHKEAPNGRPVDSALRFWERIRGDWIEVW